MLLTLYLLSVVSAYPYILAGLHSRFPNQEDPKLDFEKYPLNWKHNFDYWWNSTINNRRFTYLMVVILSLFSTISLIVVLATEGYNKPIFKLPNLPNKEEFMKFVKNNKMEKC